MNSLDVLGLGSKLSLLVRDHKLQQFHLVHWCWSPECENREKVETSTRVVEPTVVEKRFEDVSAGVNQDLPKYPLAQLLLDPS